MSNQKLTEWFPSDVKPVHVGWYHSKIAGCKRLESDFNWWWDGKKWKSAPDGWRCDQDREWRGLAEKPE